tara:strand:- start:481 stop:804 length:324 start_codon:yes stop_codon:yes gene_type:complete
MEETVGRVATVALGDKEARGQRPVSALMAPPQQASRSGETGVPEETVAPEETLREAREAIPMEASVIRRWRPEETSRSTMPLQDVEESTEMGKPNLPQAMNVRRSAV